MSTKTVLAKDELKSLYYSLTGLVENIEPFAEEIEPLREFKESAASLARVIAKVIKGRTKQ